MSSELISLWRQRRQRLRSLLDEGGGSDEVRWAWQLRIHLLTYFIGRYGGGLAAAPIGLSTEDAALLIQDARSPVRDPAPSAAARLATENRDFAGKLSHIRRQNLDRYRLLAEEEEREREEGTKALTELAIHSTAVRDILLAQWDDQEGPIARILAEEQRRAFQALERELEEIIDRKRGA